MENIVSFFTETLSGTTYIIVVVIAVILLFACIGYLAERSILRKKKEEQYVSASNQEAIQNVKEPVVNPKVTQTVVTPQPVMQANQTTVVNQASTVTPVQKSNPVTPQVVPEINAVASEVKTVVTPTVNAQAIPNTTTPQNVMNTSSSNVTQQAIPEIQLSPNTNSQ